ncbi:MAG: trigger factor [Lachnospiraceae bacterium]|nr:trigger factor [Lachnospiraceae bacterium]
MKKRLCIILSLVLASLLSACQDKISVGGNSYEADLVTSGYYLDKASMSDAALIEALSNVKEITRPASLGKVEMPDFSTIEIVDPEPIEITDEMVEAEIERIRDAEVTYQAIMTKRKAVMTDRVTIDFKGFADGKEIDGGSGEDFQLVLGSGQFIPGFEEKVAGHLAGEPFKIKVTFPEDYAEPLAGKDATFDITIKGIEEAVTPEVDNLFIVNHTKTGSYSVDDFKEEIRERLRKSSEFMQSESTVYQVSDKLISGSKFEPTEEALAWQFSAIMSQYNSQAEQSGTNLATMFASSGESVANIYSTIKDQAKEAIKSEMIYDALSNRFKVEVSDEETKEWFEQALSAYGLTEQMSYDDYVDIVGIDNMKKSVMAEKLFLKASELCKHVTESKEE